MINKELLKGSTPLLILAMLEKRDMYGYEMITEIEQASAGIFQFKEGTLYPLLHALEADGLIVSYWSEGVGARRRKYYRITPRGGSRLAERKEEWTTYRTAVERVLGEGQA
ncbi:PadR family transcriptional regulator [Aneurinibacillus soli]|uniref:Lineage-specific thermal regulator protein n=2 Tax=Aneurinibacillus soli TaxID=1500254 RepID=A0A0U5B1A0_9BACL|nr:PadR family transcriptional regulator [Aneurinibacillus soli]BAU28354.1 lineage-specific thermal regulator protein [Aneurinibacillus soli]